MNEPHRKVNEQSHMEMLDADGTTRLDPERAHAAAGDPDCAAFLPEECILCWATYLAAEEAVKADEEVTRG